MATDFWRTTRATIAIPLLLATAPVSQGEAPAWTLPERSAALYERQHEVVLLQPKADKTTWRPRFVREMNPPLLFGSALDGTKRAIAGPISDVRDIARQVAFDLRLAEQGGAVEYELPLTGITFGARIRARFARMEASGAQKITGKILPLREKSDPRYVTDQQARILGGELEIERVYDARAGRVDSFSSRLELQWHDLRKDAEIRRARFEIRETWKWSCDIAADSAIMRRTVSHALERGIAYLKASLQRALLETGGGGEFPAKGRAERGWNWPATANLALVLHALVRCEEDPRTPLMREAYKRLRSAAPQGVYSRAAGILALEALYVLPREAEQLRSGLVARPSPRMPSAEDKALISAWAADLVRRMEAATRPGDPLRWRDGSSYDNDQAAWVVPALGAASLCGVEIDGRIFRDAVEHWLATALASGDAALRLSWYQADASPETQLGREGFTSGDTVPTFSWGHLEGMDGMASYTLAAVSALAICRRELRARGLLDTALRERIDARIRGGLAWIAARFSLRHHPTVPFYWNALRYRYPYFLHRAAELTRVQTIGDHDWYFEAALHLAQWQGEDGRIGNLDETCWALLVLKREAKTTLTGK